MYYNEYNSKVCSTVYFSVVSLSQLSMKHHILCGPFLLAKLLRKRAPCTLDNLKLYKCDNKVILRTIIEALRVNVHICPIMNGSIGRN